MTVEIKSAPEKGLANIFGSIYLGENEFAIDVNFIQEVVDAPKSYSRVPLAPEYLIGLFNLRGTVIPVVDLHLYFGNRRHTDSSESKVAIIELNECCIGLLFDRTGEVFSGYEEDRSDLAHNSPDCFISGVFKMDGGQRLVQVLDATKLFSLGDIPRDTNASRLGRNRKEMSRGPRSQCISFTVGDSNCALPISAIQEILKVSEIMESPLPSPHSLGMINLRGVTVPIIDFPAFLGYRPRVEEAHESDHNSRIIVMRIENEVFGLLVDSVKTIISYFPDEFVEFPQIDQKRSGMIAGCITGKSDTDYILLDPDSIFTNTEIEQLAKGHKKLYKSARNEISGLSGRNVKRKTYITFLIGGVYGVYIDEVREIIELPENLMKPPHSQGGIAGILNLRGKLVTVFDPRKWYGENASDGQDFVNRKILIFEKKGIHFGLIVDEVRAIINVMESDILPLPKILHQTHGNGDDILEAIQAKSHTGSTENILVFNTESLADRATSLIFS